MSIMSLPLLITEATTELRKRYALDTTSNLSSKYDTLILDTKDAKGIEQIRVVTQKLSKTPLNSKYTSVVILEAQNLTLEAQNALLKPLEETPERGRIILTAPTRESVLSTISSRCEQVKPISNSNLENNYKKLDKYLSKKFYDRFISADKLDWGLWLSFWRKSLLESVAADFEVTREEKSKKILNYIRLNLRLNKLRRKKVSQKLINTIILIQAPISLLDT